MINKILHQNEQNRDLVRLDSDLAEKCISHIEAEEQALAEERARLKEIFKGRIVIVLDAAMDDDRHMASWASRNYADAINSRWRRSIGNTSKNRALRQVEKCLATFLVGFQI